MRFPSPAAADYRSPPAAPGWLSRALPGAVFYARMASIVWRASRIAKAGSYTDREWVASSLEVVALLESVGVSLTIENIGAFVGVSGPAVVVGNHMSTLETFVLPSVLAPHKPMTYIVKRELVEMPVFKHVMRSRQPVVVGRASARDDLKIVLEEGEARLRSGVSIVVFPQTTRAASWAPAEFNSIAIKLARRAGVPVIPLALRSDAWGIGRLIKDCGPIRPSLPVHFCFGDPLTVSGGGRETHEAVTRFITEKVTAWGVPVLEESVPAGGPHPG
jgi:1-acyl-sn-glycerol-3-phosphate acyltransferase